MLTFSAVGDAASPIRILITGANGFVGRHLLPALRAGWPQAFLIGTSRKRHAHGMDAVITLDLDDTASIAAAVDTARPDAVVHLAAQSDVGAGFRDSVGTWRTNMLGTVALGEAVLRLAPSTRVLHISSSEVYGLNFRSGLALSETAGFAPANPYADSKAAADLAVGEMALRGLRAVRLRSFAHIGPGQSRNFVVSAFAYQVARIEAGLQEPVLFTGALDRWRDFHDVRDVCAAYVKALQIVLATPDRLPPGIAINLCSGTSRRVGDILETLLGFSSISPQIRQEESRLRPTDVERVNGDPSLAASLLGWKPRIPWQDTLRSILVDWRARVAAGE